MLLGVALLAMPIQAFAAGRYPNAMASTGDSITRAFNTGFFPFTDNAGGSWSTGTNSTVASHYTRLLALNPKIRGKNYNDARSGAKMQDLAGQMTTVNTRKVGYVTVLMGGNDVCTPSESTMTSVADFEAQFTAAMNTLTSGSPSAQIFVATIPDVYQLWLIEKGNLSARTTWGLFSVCQSMLANPLSTDEADIDRRQRVRQREIDFNDALLRVCAAYRQCRSDNGAVFNTAFTAADVSTRDYFHPSLAGQAKLAAGTWAVSYWGP
ncbi:MAG TPA: SGNH/GDSL hydrolase family protein [Candidatus Eisenbacteria bacterium]|nr:SGNH/GDSL hydrolase family protein [Candidatus Eisenbacteria bacterium]